MLSLSIHIYNISQVLHNIAIVENLQDGFSNPKKFLEVLNDVKVCVNMLVVALKVIVCLLLFLVNVACHYLCG